MKKYDAIVIGSGGGSKISTPAARLGHKIAIIERSAVGGTCLNRGCIPSKMLIHPANVARMIEDAAKYNIKVHINGIDFGKIVRRISKTVDGDSNAIKRAYKGQSIKNLDYYAHHATFLSDKVIKVGKEEITAKKIFIATGARPSIPSIEGLEGTPYMTSTEALRNTIIPKHLLVIGGGYIACELGHAYSALGANVTMVVRGELIAREDKDVRKEFTKVFSQHQRVIYAKTKKVSYTGKKFSIHTEDKRGREQILRGDALLIATGVKPNTDNLGLENTGIKTSKQGFIKVNSQLETNVQDVYSLGDCVGNYMFRHSVNFEGEYLFGQHYGKEKSQPIKYPPVPHAVFSHPEIAGVGKTEDELIAEKKKYIVGLNDYKASAMGLARIADHSFVKLLFDKKTKKLLGAHIIGEEAATMIHQLIYAMTFDATVDDLLRIIYIHPALPEIVRNAARKAKAQF